MRRISLIVGVIGLGILIAMLVPGWEEVSSLEGRSVGEVVSISGQVGESRDYGQGKLLVIGETEVYCDSCQESYVGLQVKVVGVIEDFPEDLRIRAFFIDSIK